MNMFRLAFQALYQNEEVIQVGELSCRLYGGDEVSTSIPTFYVRVSGRNYLIFSRNRLDVVGNGNWRRRTNLESIPGRFP